MSNDERPLRVTKNERPPRLRLIRVFLSLLVGFMAGLVGWTVAVMAALLGQGPVAVQLPSLPIALHAVAFFGPAVVAGCWLFAALGSARQ